MTCNEICFENKNKQKSEMKEVFFFIKLIWEIKYNENHCTLLTIFLKGKLC